MTHIDMYNSNNIADRIKSRARSEGISIKELLSRCELGINTVSKIANGKDIYSKNLAKIADYLKCSVDYLLGRTDNPELNTAVTKDRISEIPVNSKIVSPDSEQTSNDVPQKMIRYYDIPASAGTGSFIDDESPYKYINVAMSDDVKRADFLIRVSGDSMMPKFNDGDRLLIEQTTQIDGGQYGVFIVNGESLVKKLGYDELISLNPEYDNIKIGKDDAAYCVGRVISVLPEDSIL